MTNTFQVISSVLAALFIGAGIILAFYRFVLRRERFTILTLNIEAKVIKQVENLLLVSITVRLKNKGRNRISARRYDALKDKSKENLYEDDVDVCMHAGTLKIRSVPNEKSEREIDWYSLKPSIFENINYLAEYQDPETSFNDVDFWLEPYDRYNQQIMIWLNPGTYVIKAYFLGKMIDYQEEEYWSCSKLFELKSQL